MAKNRGNWKAKNKVKNLEHVSMLVALGKLEQGDRYHWTKINIPYQKVLGMLIK